MTDTAAKVKRPASQYYWGDWWKDKGLHSCSLTARGLWHEMNCLMHEGEPYGHLTLNGKPMTTAQLANQCRITPAVCRKLLDELLAAGVPSKDDATGALFSRRMVRDERIREARAAGGKAGAEHGIKGAEGGKKGGRPKQAEGGSETPLEGFEKPPPSSSSSSSPSGNSEAKASDGKPSGKPAADQSKTELWHSAVSLLGSQGMAEPQARSFIGKLSKDYKDAGEDIVLTAVRAAVSEQPPDARAYLKATCQRLAGEREGRPSANANDWTRTAT